MNPEIELRHLRYFVAVAEELHFGRAALRLHLAQPPLSQQIRKLEDILGHALFARTSRAVRLTAAGQVFLDRARRTLRTVQEDIDEARSIGRGEIGSLRVGFIGSGMLTPIPAMLGRYRRKHPRADLQLREGMSSQLMQAIIAGVIDIAFLRDGGALPGLESETLFTEPFVAVLPANHPLAHRKTISAAALRNEPFVFFPQVAGPVAYSKTLSLCEAYGFRPRIVQEAPQWLTVLRLVGAGLGVSIAPACVQKIAAPDAVCIRLRAAHVQSDIEIAWRANEDRAIVTAFRELARSLLARPNRKRHG
jgi:DNA-binding transcriptional LysR family regulator